MTQFFLASHFSSAFVPLLCVCFLVYVLYCYTRPAIDLFLLSFAIPRTFTCLFLTFKVEKVNQRVKHLKRQLDETEEEVTRLNAAKRKLQRDFDEQVEQNEAAQRELTQLKGRMRFDSRFVERCLIQVLCNHKE